jgi:hypothetical protein
MYKDGCAFTFSGNVGGIEWGKFAYLIFPPNFDTKITLFTEV